VTKGSLRESLPRSFGRLSRSAVGGVFDARVVELPIGEPNCNVDGLALEDWSAAGVLAVALIESDFPPSVEEVRRL
jgi:hypothetical protein